MTNNQTLKALLETAVATACVVCATTGSASAVTLTPGTTFSTFLECDNDGISLVVGQNPTDAAGWQYAIDSSTDDVFGGSVGGNAYEIYSMGVMETIVRGLAPDYSQMHRSCDRVHCNYSIMSLRLHSPLYF